MNSIHDEWLLTTCKLAAIFNCKVYSQYVTKELSNCFLNDLSINNMPLMAKYTANIQLSCFQIVFWTIWILIIHLYLNFIRKKQYDDLTSEITWHKIYRRYASILYLRFGDLITWPCITADIGTLSILDRFTQSNMAQNQSHI